MRVLQSTEILAAIQPSKRIAQQTESIGTRLLMTNFQTNITRQSILTVANKHSSKVCLLIKATRVFYKT